MSVMIECKPGDLVANPDNLRADVGDLSELATSIASMGVLQPLVATGNPDEPKGLTLVAGHRRLAAVLSMNGNAPKTISVLVKDQSYEDNTVDGTTTMLVENIQRKDLNPIEVAVGFQRLIDAGCKQAEIAKLVGISPAIVSRRLKLLRLPPAGQQAVADGSLPLDRAEMYLALPDDTVMAVAIEHGWSQFRVEQAVLRAEREKAAAKIARVCEAADVTLIQDDDYHKLHEDDDGTYRWETVEVEVKYRTDEDGNVLPRSSRAGESNEAPFEVWADPADQMAVESLARKKGVDAVTLDLFDESWPWQDDEPKGGYVLYGVTKERIAGPNDVDAKRKKEEAQRKANVAKAEKEHKERMVKRTAHLAEIVQKSDVKRAQKAAFSVVLNNHRNYSKALDVLGWDEGKDLSPADEAKLVFAIVAVACVTDDYLLEPGARRALLKEWGFEG